MQATNSEFLKLQEKLGLSLYEDICDEKEFILMSEKITTQQLEEGNKKLNVIENENENEKENENGNENENENEKF